MSAFDPSSFLDATTTEALEKRPPLPVGDYTAVVGEPTISEWVGKADPSKSGYRCDCQLEVDVPYDIQQELGMSTATLKVKHGMMLDTTPTGGIDWSKGKNGGLRQMREALGMNNSGETFSMRNMQGRVLKVKLGHREYPEGSGILFEEVLGLAKA